MQTLHLKCEIYRPVRLQGGARRTMFACGRPEVAVAWPGRSLPSRPGRQVPRHHLVTIETHRLPRTPATHC
jgi:hypothetical protein